MSDTKKPKKRRGGIWAKYHNLSWPEKILKFLASLELAVMVILSMAVISAIGTIVEARYDAQYAQKMVFHSPYMYFTLGLLCINLINVMIDRWPWKRHHTGFVLAHIGIITLIGGSVMTRYWGIDGSMVLEQGRASRFVSMPTQEIAIYKYGKNKGVEQMFRKPVDFLLNPPSPANKLNFPVGGKTLSIEDYYHYALPKSRILPSDDDSAAPAIRVQLESSRFNVTQWLVRDKMQPFSEINFGPARLVITDDVYIPKGGNELILKTKKGSDVIEYQVHSARKDGSKKKGTARAGDTIETGWMDMKVRFLSYHQKARQIYDFEKRKRPTPLTVSAVKFTFAGQPHWVALNSSVRLFTEKSAFVAFFGNTRMNLGFDLFLKKFEIGRYQGTMRAASYASDVLVPGKGEVKIYMNNPLKHESYTFYQASFQEDEAGRPVASILSVNRDPGRWVKNLGSFLIVLGIIMLFYFKRMMLRKKSV